MVAFACAEQRLMKDSVLTSKLINHHIAGGHITLLAHTMVTRRRRSSERFRSTVFPSLSVVELLCDIVPVVGLALSECEGTHRAMPRQPFRRNLEIRPLTLGISRMCVPARQIAT